MTIYPSRPLIETAAPTRLEIVRQPPAARLDDAAFWKMLRGRVLPLRPSQYDVTSRCNLTCEGCLFFSGEEYMEHKDQTDLGKVEAFFASEAVRGINYGYFGGAEPSLAEKKLLAAARHIPYGVVVTNGTRRISDEVPYRIHISVWGKPERSRALRGASMLHKQVKHYRNDPRAVFVFTITASNIDEIAWIAAFCADQGVSLTFNHYSPTMKYLDFLQGAVAGDAFHARTGATDELRLGAHHLHRCQEIIARLIDEGPGHILYDHAINAIMHHPDGLYPDRDTEGTANDCRVRLDKVVQHHNTDLSRSTGKCCTPNVACETCRLYAHSFSTLLTRVTRDFRRTADPAPMIALWRLWCAIFLNHEVLATWHPLAARTLRNCGVRLDRDQTKGRLSDEEVWRGSSEEAYRAGWW